ncbi:hypothetical protein NBRC10512_004400 [Rhodotorula toruloides]|uniref:RHTO0S15e03708g1_1 n=2 Tax=Rhodotorula toruloides TaxID=5286 RepID=A0A061BJ39_RHOTO|nr:uncharacterized protein RHTO_03141 [Rhodotorula toruloides NP11]EMS25413.1 hypothetical protein RHTO_03141 [Rhodotorula toruloides NP11]CDR47922.1 RHTO0S15e03708g1_1 [Rhodotorula toruloides]
MMPLSIPGGRTASPASTRSPSRRSSDSSGPPLVSSTSPPSIPHLPPSPRTARPGSSILLNPLAPRSPPAPSTSTLARALPGKRRPSVVVQVVHSPPPPGYFSSSNDPYSSSPPRTDVPYQHHGLRSRSVSPDHTPQLADSPERQPQPALDIPTSSLSPSSSSKLDLARSPGSSSILTSSSRDSAYSAGGTSVKFAPLPPGRRAHRSNSLSIGVASRAKMISAQGGTPNMRGAKYAGPLQWYEGGPLPEDVYSWRDAQKGITKLFKRVKPGSSSKASTSSASSTGSASPLSSPTGSFQPLPGTDQRGRSMSTSSSGTGISSSSDADEAKRMEREAKGKSREIEHIEEALEEDVEDAEVEPEREDVPATVPDEEDEEEDERGEDGGGLSEDEGTTASELTAPRTPPEGLNVVIDEDLDVERRRVLKGKGKAVDDGEHGEVRVAS